MIERTVVISFEEPLGASPIHARERPFTLKPRRVNCKPVLHRTVEPARIFGNYG